MDARFYNSEDIDIERLANDLENIYRAQGYQVQQIGSKDQILVQLKKGGELETLVGMGVALSVIIQRTTGGVLAMIGQQKWMDKAAVGAIGAAGLVFFPLLPLAVTAGVGALRQMSLANQILNVVDGLVRQQRPSVQVGPVPVQLMPQIQQQWVPPTYSSPPPIYTPPVQYIPPPPQPQVVISQPAAATPPAPAKLRCPNCNTPYEAGDTFCSGCGKSLVAPKTICPNCQAELKPDASFCPKCGASVFQTLSATQAAKPVPLAPQPYMPPTVAYTPPAAPPKLTPPSTPPQQPQPYVPPVPQEPPVTPQPKVTIVPGTPKQQPPATSKPLSRPETPYYIPSTQASAPDAPTVASTQASAPQAPTPPAETPYYVPSTTQATPKAQTPPTPPKPIVAKPAAVPAYDPNATWGYLTFSDGKQVNLSGERAVVGRYDHDLGGITPEVDLGSMQGAETVSRVHAAFEHIGSAFTLMDLNSTNTTRINGKRLEPDKATPINDGDTLQFGKVTCTFKKA